MSNEVLLAKNQMKSHLSCVLENYACLRDEFRKKFLERKPRIDSTLQLFRRIFILKNVLNFEQLFNEKFENLVKGTVSCGNGRGNGLVCQIETSMTSYWYTILREQDGHSTSVKLFSRGMHFPLLILSEKDLCWLLQGGEKIILTLVKEHKISGGTHLSSCDICLHKDNLMCVLESSSKPVQEYGDDKVSDVLESLDDKATKSLVSYDSESSSKEPRDIGEARRPESHPRTERTESKVQECSDDVESRAKATENQQSADIGKARQPHPESHPSTEQTKSKEEKVRVGDEIVQLKEENAALVREKEELGTQLEAAHNELAVLKDECQLLEQKLNSPWRQKIQDVTRKVNGTCNAYRTEFRTALDSRDNTLSNFKEKLEALETENLECKEKYERKIRKLKAEVAELKTSLGQVLKERDEIARAKGYSGPLQCSSRYLLGQESDEKAAESSKPSEKKDESSRRNGNKPTNLKDGDDKVQECSDDAESRAKATENQESGDIGKARQPDPESHPSTERTKSKGPTTSHNPGTDEFKRHKKELAKAAVEMKKFWNDNKEKIEFEKSEGKLNCVITYYDRSRNDTMYELFADEQEALKWAYENKGLMEESYPFIKVRSEESGELTITDFMIVKIELIHPSTEEVLCERFGIADTAAEIASFPYEPKIFSSLMNSVIWVNNDKSVPIVFAKLRIDGVLLPKIYEIEVENDKDAAAIGIPQMHDLMHMCDEKMRKIMQETLNILKAHGL